MNLRCIYCQTPFTLGRAEMLAAIVSMEEKHMNHYDAHCPRCRRANSISRERMELFYPNWQEAAKEQAAAPATPPPAAPTPASAFQKTEPLPKGAKEAAQIVEAKKHSSHHRTRAGKATAARKAVAGKPATTKKPAAAKKPAAKSTATKKPATKKTTASKPVAKKAPAKSKKK